MWEDELNCRKRGPQKRGRTKITLADLAEELRIKQEKVRIMSGSLGQLHARAKNEVIDEDDLEEYEELLGTDEDDSDIEVDSLNGKHCHSTISTI